MTLAKTTAIFGGLFYFSIFLAQLFLAKSFVAFYSTRLGISNRSFFAAILAMVFLVAVVNFSYGVFLNIREKTGEEIKSALFYALQMIVFPLVLFIATVLVFVGL